MKEIKNEKLFSILPTVIIGILLVASILTSGFNFKKGVEEPRVASLSAEEAGQKAVEYINENILLDQNTASLKNIVDFKADGFCELYKFQVDVNGQTFDSYITQDGKFIFPEAIDLELQTEEETSSSTEIPKQDLPDVKLFVMSYCPYGLQAQKGILPAYNLLKDKANIEIHFVDYIMHDKEEIDENLRQYCIQKEDARKYIEYLNCFVEDGDYNKCLSEAGIDEGKLNICVTETDKKFGVTEQYNDETTWLNGLYPKFDVDTALNEKYGVQGSPTLVINDAVIVSNQQYCPVGDVECVVIPDLERSPEKYKTVICQSFNSPPDECSQVLSSETPSPSFGGGTSSSSGGSCE